jgi:hypothetical protein
MNGNGVSERGSALIAVVTLVGTMMVLSLIFLRVGQQVSNEQLATVNGTRAELLAEAGISEALESLRSGGTGIIGQPWDPAYLGGGVVWVEATDLGGGIYQLDSMAMKDNGRAALRAVVGEGAGGGGGGPGGVGSTDTFFTMLFSNKPLALNQDIVIDSWDSTLGTYASQATNTMGTITYAASEAGAASNTTVTIAQGTHVFGDIHVGPGQTASQSASAYVSGTTTQAGVTVPLAPISVPAISASGTYSVANNATKTLASGNYHFTSMTQGKFSTLKVVGPATIVVDGYTTGASATLEIDATNGPVNIYDTGVWSVDKNYKLINKPGSPVDGAFMISSTGTVQFDQGSVIKFGFYCPNSIIEVNQGAEVWGALVADEITVNQGTKFHFDKNLEDYSLPWSVPAMYFDPTLAFDPEILAWSTIAFPVQAYMTDRRSPFALLAVERSDLRAPAAAWEEEEPVEGQ